MKRKDRFFLSVRSDPRAPLRAYGLAVMDQA